VILIITQNRSHRISNLLCCLIDSSQSRWLVLRHCSASCLAQQQCSVRISCVLRTVSVTHTHTRAHVRSSETKRCNDSVSAKHNREQVPITQSHRSACFAMLTHHACSRLSASTGFAVQCAMRRATYALRETCLLEHACYLDANALATHLVVQRRLCHTITRTTDTTLQPEHLVNEQQWPVDRQYDTTHVH
jgi:hypothetical protein